MPAKDPPQNNSDDLTGSAVARAPSSASGRPSSFAERPKPDLTRAGRLATLNAEQLATWLGLAPLLERMAFDPPQFDPYLAKLRRLAQPEKVETTAQLATLLQSGAGLQAVISGLDLTAWRLLLFAAWRDGALSRADVMCSEEFLDGCTPERELHVEAAAERLRFLLLAEPFGGNESPPEGWVRLPADVCKVIDLPAATALAGLANVVSDELALTLKAHGIKDIPPRRDDRASVLLTLLNNPPHVASLVATLSDDARRVLALLIGRLTPMHCHQLGVQSIGLLDRRYRTPQYGAHVPTVLPAKSPITELYDVGFIGIDPYQQTAWVWREVAQTLRPNLIANWAIMPAPVQVPFDANRSHIARPLANLERLLDLWRASPPAALADGGVGVAPVRAVAKKIGIPPGHAGLLVHLAVGLGLLKCSVVGTEGRGRNARAVYGWTVTDSMQEWLRLPATQRWTILVHAWLTDDSLADGEGLPERWAPGYRDEPPFRRQYVLRTIEGFDVGCSASAIEVINTASHRWPNIVWPAQSAAVIEALRALGLVEPEGRVGLTNAARALLDGTLNDGADAASDGAAGSPTLVVQGDNTVIATPDVDLDTRLFLDRIATLESDAGARVYRLTEASLTAALAGGLSVTDIEQGLAARSRTAVPQSVSYLIADVERKRKLITLASAVTVIASTDPVLIASAIRVKAAGLRELGPYTAVSTLAAEKVRAALAAKGVMVTVEQAAAPPPMMLSSGRSERKVSTIPKVGPSPYVGSATLRSEAARLLHGAGAKK